MNLVELTQHIQSEEAAEEYLRKMGILHTFTECPYCEGERVGKIHGIVAFGLSPITNKMKISYDLSIVSLHDIEAAVKNRV